MDGRSSSAASLPRVLTASHCVRMIRGRRLAGVLGALAGTAAVAPAQSPSDTALVRALAVEVRDFIRTRPGASDPFYRDQNERMTDLLVRLQAQSRDVGGAFLTATTLNGSPRAFQWIADEQRRSGDRNGLGATIAASRDRETLGASVVRWYVSADSFDQAATIARSLPLSYSRRLLEAEIAMARAGRGDWSAADTLSLDAFAPVDRVDLLAQLGDRLRQSGSPKLDSIAKLAERTVAQISDPNERQNASMLMRLRIRNEQPAGFVRMVAAGDGVLLVSSAAIDTATRGPARVQALRNRAVTGLRRDGDLDAALRVLADPVVTADTSSLASALVDLAMIASSSSTPLAPSFYQTLDRAEQLAIRVDSSFADQTRIGIVTALARRDPARARVVAGRITGSFARSRARAAIIRQMMATDVSRAINEAVALRPAAVADTLVREAATLQIKAGAFADAAQTRQRIAGAELRRFVGADIAIAQLARGQQTEATRGLEAVLGELDAWGDYLFASRTVLPALIGLGRTPQILAWARAQKDFRGAYARMAVMSALMTKS